MFFQNLFDHMQKWSRDIHQQLLQSNQVFEVLQKLIIAYFHHQLFYQTNNSSSYYDLKL